MYKKIILPVFCMIGSALQTRAASPEPFTLLRLPVTYIYGYNSSFVIAEVLNALHGEVAYSSFESTDKGNWTYTGNMGGNNGDPGRTGFKYYNLNSGAVTKGDLPPYRYTLSYWSKGGAATVTGDNLYLISESSDITINGWVFHEYDIQFMGTGSIHLSGNVQIDEVRLHPFTAQMVTYTYNPLVGKTSETDINCITTFYEYDELQRLKCVKDQYGNIRKNYIYHLKNQL